ncbi:MAG: YhbY family RNA-binding protein [Firmicutes bacterium]|jgi:RNA-binding protein|nr:YhbY family RNA-binding protein [Bacillota bacterium]
MRGKERSYLKSLAHNKKPVTQIGKEGITEAVIDRLRQDLQSHELIKVRLLDSSLLGAKEAAIEVCDRLSAEFIQAIGNIFVIYRPNPELDKEKRIKLPK